MTVEGRPLRVVELAQGFAGPVCGRLFAALGHEVVKCEPPGGDYLRGRGERGDAARLMAHGFAAVNAGKHSVVVDLGTVEGRDAARSLVDTADVVVSDLHPAEAERLGIVGSTPMWTPTCRSHARTASSPRRSAGSP